MTQPERQLEKVMQEMGMPVNRLKTKETTAREIVRQERSRDTRTAQRVKRRAALTRTLRSQSRRGSRGKGVRVIYACMIRAPLLSRRIN